MFIASVVSSSRGFSFDLAEVSQESAHEKRNILLPLAQRRHRDVDHVQAEIEIVAKLPLAHQLRQILVRRRDQAHVRLQELIAAHALEGALFADHAEQFHLRALVDLADLIEKNRAAVRLLEPADAALVRAGKCAAFVPEKFAFEQVSARAPRSGPSRISPCSGG